MDKSKKTHHVVTVYLFNNTFIVVGSVELPPIFVWTEVNPVSITKISDKEKLAQSIEVARSQSVSRFNVGHDNPDVKPWNGKKIWNHALKSWSIWWKNDESVILEKAEPSNKYRGIKEWKLVAGTEKKLSPPVSFQDIAQEILRQLQT